MSIRNITLMGHPVLMSPAAPVDDPLSADCQSLITDMFDTMLAIGGVGIAAPQIGISQRVIICLMRERSPGLPLGREDFTVLINPEITLLGDEIVEGWEGCLSLPGMRGQVPRHRRAHYRALNPEGQKIEATVDGFPAIVLQHEGDHLDGMLYPMRMTNMSSLQYVDPIRRLVSPVDATDKRINGGEIL